MRHSYFLLIAAFVLAACDAVEPSLGPKKVTITHNLRISGQVLSAGTPVAEATVVMNVRHLNTESFHTLTSETGRFDLNHSVSFSSNCGLLTCDTGCSATVRASTPFEGWDEKYYTCSDLDSDDHMGVVFELSQDQGGASASTGS